MLHGTARALYDLELSLEREFWLEATISNPCSQVVLDFTKIGVLPLARGILGPALSGSGSINFVFYSMTIYLKFAMTLQLNFEYYSVTGLSCQIWATKGNWALIFV